MKKKISTPTFKTKKQIFISNVLPTLNKQHIKDITKNDLLDLIQHKKKQHLKLLQGLLVILWTYGVMQ